MSRYHPIADFPRYEISDEGHVRNISTGRILKGRAHRGGYRLVRLFTEPNVYVDRTVHSLVMETFVGPRPEGMCVCHNDGDATNNALTNLRYGSLVDNQRDRIEHGTLGTPHTLRVVRIIRGLSKLGFTNRRIAEICSVTTKYAYKVANNYIWQTVV